MREEKQREKILVLNTLETDNSNEVKKLFGAEEIIETAGYQIRHCVGCNACWIRTPGRCAIKDDYENLYQKILQADIIVFVAKERFGMVSWQLKNIVDADLAGHAPYLYQKWAGQACFQISKMFPVYACV